MRETNVRKRFTAMERARIIAEYRNSGLTQRQVAERFGISCGCLSIWLRQARENASGGSPQGWLELPALPANVAVSYKLQLRGGATLEVPPGFRRQEVFDLLRLLTQL